MEMYGKDNSGPAREVWSIGDRVMCCVRGRDHGKRGVVAAPRRERNASETTLVWVTWDDGVSGFIDPGSLDCAR